VRLNQARPIDELGCSRHWLLQLRPNICSESADSVGNSRSYPGRSYRNHRRRLAPRCVRRDDCPRPKQRGIFWWRPAIRVSTEREHAPADGFFARLQSDEREPSETGHVVLARLHPDQGNPAQRPGQSRTISRPVQPYGRRDHLLIKGRTPDLTATQRSRCLTWRQAADP